MSLSSRTIAAGFALLAAGCLYQERQLDVRDFNRFDYLLRGVAFGEASICADAGTVVCANLERLTDGSLVLTATVLEAGDPLISNYDADLACEGSEDARFRQVSRTLDSTEVLAVDELFGRLDVFEYNLLIGYLLIVPTTIANLGKPTDQGGSCTHSIFVWDDTYHSFDPLNTGTFAGFRPDTGNQLISLVNELATSQ